MPKPTKKANRLHQQLLSGLIDRKPTSWERKLPDPKDPRRVVTQKVTRQSLRFPLAQNVSEFNVELAAKRWMP